MKNFYPPADVSSAQNGWLAGKQRFPIFILWLVLITGPLFLAFQFKNSTGFLFGQAKEIRIKKSDVIRLFSLKANETTQMHLKKDGAQVMAVEVSMVNHIYPGTKSGAIVARLNTEDGGSRLLMNRKERKQGLVYWLAILPDKGELAYKMKQETSDEFILIQVSKNEVVTE